MLTTRQAGREPGVGGGKCGVVGDQLFNTGAQPCVGISQLPVADGELVNPSAQGSILAGQLGVACSQVSVLGSQRGDLLVLLINQAQ